MLEDHVPTPMERESLSQLSHQTCLILLEVIILYKKVECIHQAEGESVQKADLEEDAMQMKVDLEKMLQDEAEVEALQEEIKDE